MKRIVRKLSLNRETLRNLGNEEPPQGIATITCPHTRTCDTCVPC